MTIDITTPEHREALRVASTCMLLDKARTRDEWIAHCSDEPLALAFEALSDPAKAAELVRALVERAGVPCVDDLGSPGSYPYVVAEYFGNNILIEWWAGEFDDEPMAAELVARERWLSIVARLLALAPNAGADAVLAALRGES